MHEPSLKALQAFEALTRAEAAVFDELAREERHAEGTRIPLDGRLFVVTEGSVRLSVDGPRGSSIIAVLERGGLAGELALFEPEPVAIIGEAQAGTVGHALPREELQGAFRYSRSGAAKFMTIFARALSGKIRSANALLGQSGAAASPELRPAPLGDVDLQRIKSLCVGRSLSAESVLFREGDAGSELFVIGRGEVEILREVEGKPVSLARLGPGDFFGEMPSSTSSRARPAPWHAARSSSAFCPVKPSSASPNTTSGPRCTWAA